MVISVFPEHQSLTAQVPLLPLAPSSARGGHRGAGCGGRGRGRSLVRKPGVAARRAAAIAAGPNKSVGRKLREPSRCVCESFDYSEKCFSAVFFFSSMHTMCGSPRQYISFTIRCFAGASEKDWRSFLGLALLFLQLVAITASLA